MPTHVRALAQTNPWCVRALVIVSLLQVLPLVRKVVSRHVGGRPFNAALDAMRPFFSQFDFIGNTLLREVVAGIWLAGWWWCAITRIAVTSFRSYQAP